MKFQLVDNYRYWWPVTVRIPDPENPGKIIEQVLKIQFEAQGRDTDLAAQEEYRALTDPKEIAAHENAHLKSICKNWDDVMDVENELVPFTPEKFDAALQNNWFREGVYAAYGQSLIAEEAALGN